MSQCGESSASISKITQPREKMSVLVLKKKVRLTIKVMPGDKAMHFNCRLGRI